MGTVYLVEHVSIQKSFALKVLYPELARQGDLAARFLQEARVASRISHENVVAISDFGETEDGLVYFVMEYVEGLNLDALVRAEGPLPWVRARPILLQIVSALKAAHEQGIIHRDIKPANVIVGTRAGRPDFIKVLDFGIAKVVASTHASEVVTNHAIEVLGTPAYMAPEQGQGDAVDFRTDVYGCGCLLFHVLTGRPPFQGSGQFGVLMKQQLEPPPSPSSRLPEGALPAHVDALVLKALAKAPEDRWQSMDALAAAIDGTLGESTGGATPGGLNDEANTVTVPPLPARRRGSGPGRTRDTIRGRRWWIVVVGGLLLLASLAFAWVLFRRQPTPAIPSDPPALAPGKEALPPLVPALEPSPVPTPAPPTVNSTPTATKKSIRSRADRGSRPPRGGRPREPRFEPLSDPIVD
jgi:serine/threonine-protein kinase